MNVVCGRKAVTAEERVAVSLADNAPYQTANNILLLFNWEICRSLATRL